jgi:hypothetical protein
MVFDFGSADCLFRSDDRGVPHHAVALIRSRAKVFTMHLRVLRFLSGYRQHLTVLLSCSRGGGTVAEWTLLVSLIGLSLLTMEATVGVGLRQLLAAVLNLL